MSKDVLVDPDSNPMSRKRFGLYVVLIYIVHLLIVSYIVSPSAVFSGQPFGGADYQTHFHQTMRLSRAFKLTGKTYAYEPRFLAGHPMGVIFDVDNKAHFLFAHTLYRMGVTLAVAFNLFSFVVALIFPFIFLASTRLWGLSPRAQLLSFAASSPYFFLDTASRFFGTAGMISYLFAAMVALLVISLFYRFIESLIEGKARFYFFILVLLPLAHLIHVWGFAVLVGPLLFLYARRFKQLSKRGHLLVISLAAATLAVNFYWLYSALRYHDIVSHSYLLGQAGFWTLKSDISGITAFQPSPVSQTILLRHLFIGGAIAFIVYLFRQKDKRAWPATFVLGWMFFLTYLSAFVPLFGLTEPYRFITAFGSFGVILGAGFFVQFLNRQTLQKLKEPKVLPFTLLAFFLLAPSFIREFYLAAPEFLPTLRDEKAPVDPAPWRSEFKPVSEPIAKLAYHTVRSDYWRVAEFLTQNCKEEGRVLIEPWPLGEFMGWATDLNIIGGFPDRRMVFESAYLFRIYDYDATKQLQHKRFWGEEYNAYLKRYNIRYVVMQLPNFFMVEQNRKAMSFYHNVGHYRIYRANHDGNYFAHGNGKLKSASLNKIELENVSSSDNYVDIRFHLIKGLTCRPNCKLKGIQIADSEAKFIRIWGKPNLAENITIEYKP